MMMAKALKDNARGVSFSHSNLAVSLARFYVLGNHIPLNSTGSFVGIGYSVAIEQKSSPPIVLTINET